MIAKTSRDLYGRKSQFLRSKVPPLTVKSPSFYGQRSHPALRSSKRPCLPLLKTGKPIAIAFDDQLGFVVVPHAVLQGAGVTSRKSLRGDVDIFLLVRRKHLKQDLGLLPAGALVGFFFCLFPIVGGSGRGLRSASRSLLLPCEIAWQVLLQATEPEDCLRQERNGWSVPLPCREWAVPRSLSVLMMWGVVGSEIPALRFLARACWWLLGFGLSPLSLA